MNPFQANVQYILKTEWSEHWSEIDLNLEKKLDLYAVHLRETLFQINWQSRFIGGFNEVDFIESSDIWR